MDPTSKSPHILINNMNDVFVARPLGALFLSLGLVIAGEALGACGTPEPAAPSSTGAGGAGSAAGAGTASMAAGVAGFSARQALGGVEEYRLERNGLTVLVVPDSSAPVVTLQVTYCVGSRNEVTGTTGSTHLLEHLMFKGSENFNDAKGNSIKQYLERVGGFFNASTAEDRTNYFATVSRKDLEGYLAIEADRMRRLWLHESDRQAEMTVVRNEYERGKNDPNSVLLEEVAAAAYVALPYHHPVIGWRSDIEHVPIEKLRQFYDTFYWPNNAVITLVGDVNAHDALTLVQKYYGGYGASPQPIPPMYTEEPAQTGPRRVLVRRPGELGTVVIAHKVPTGRDADQPALEMLDAILSSGKSARLYKALVDQGLALEAGAGTELRHDLSLHTLYAALAPGSAPEQVEQALLAEVGKIQSDGVTAAEIERVRQQVRADEAYKRDGTAGIAGELNEWIAVGDWTLYVEFPQRVEQVTPADVQRVARRYLTPDQSTTGWFVPQSAAAPEKHR